MTWRLTVYRPAAEFAWVRYYSDEDGERAREAAANVDKGRWTLSQRVDGEWEEVDRG